MSDQKQYQTLIDYALRVLSFRPRSTHEMREKLTLFAKRRKISETSIETILQDLTEKKFIDDLEFVKWWVQQREAFRPKGLTVVKAELRRKGIPSDVIAEFFSQKNEGSSEFELAYSVVMKKQRMWEKLPYIEKKEKLIGLLARRGFDWDTTHNVIDTILKKAYN